MSPPASCNPPGRLIRKPIACPFEPTRRPYSVLLPMGFTVPPALLPARWALTPTLTLTPSSLPFTRNGTEDGAVCFLWHFPWGRPCRALPGIVFPWSPDFSPAAFRHMTGAAARPTDSAHIATIPRQRNRLCEKIATEIRKAGSKTAAGFSFTSGNPVLYAAADAKGMRV